MACYVTGSTVTNTTSVSNNGTIAQLLKKIDQMQRDAVLANAANQCDNCMMSAMYNTKPIAIYFCNSGVRLEVPVGDTEAVSNLFRIEEVRNDETVVLRLLVADDETGEITCTTFTIVVRISCIGAVQCFDPINCETLCTQLV